MGDKGRNMYYHDGLPRRPYKGIYKFAYAFDIDKFKVWFKARKQLNPKITYSQIARETGHTKGYISHIINDKYDIIPSNEFIATWCYTYNMAIDEMFKLIVLKPELDSEKQFKRNLEGKHKGFRGMRR